MPFRQVLDSVLDDKEEKALLTSGHYAASWKVPPYCKGEACPGRLFLVEAEVQLKVMKSRWLSACGMRLFNIAAAPEQST